MQSGCSPGWIDWERACVADAESRDAPHASRWGKSSGGPKGLIAAGARIPDTALMRSLPGAGTVKVLVVAVLVSALLLSPLSTPALASGPTTNCQLTALTNPSTVGQPATFRFFAAARLVENFPPSPSGLVTFFDGLGGGILGTAILLPALYKDNNDVTFTTSSLSLGDHTIYAVLIGPSGPCPITPSASQRVNPPPASPSNTGIGSSANPSNYGQNVTFTATVARQGGGAVAGTVQFRVDGTDLSGPQTLDGVGRAFLSSSALAVGSHSVTAAFKSGNPDTLDSSGALAGGQTVQRADTQTGVTSSRNPSELGQAVTFTAHVSAVSPGAGTPGGTVQFSDNGTGLGSPQSLDGSGNASIPTAGLTVGGHTITATYTPSGGSYNASSGSMSQTVERARTTLTYGGASSGDFHDPAVVSARLTRTDNSAPLAGKTVTFTMGSESCAQVTDATGVAACSITPTEPAGLFGVSAAFAGDGNYVASADAKPFTVTREETTTSYTGPTVIAQGNPVTLSGRLLEDGITAIMGRTLTLTLGSGAGSQSCTAGPTDGSGSAQCTVTSVTVTQGPNPVQASFAGDGYYLPSVDASKSVIVFAFPSRGIFVIGDRAAAGPAPVTFWGSQWRKENTLSGGIAPSAFEGFADNASTNPPQCGGTWTTSPGNSSSPVDSIPAYMGVAVSTSVTKHGDTISGDITTIVVVVTDPGYAANPGHPGTGSIIATYCQR